MTPPAMIRFSALQRAENSSIGHAERRTCAVYAFQCSSASRKFLNCTFPRPPRFRRVRFSALQRAENSSIQFDGSDAGISRPVSVLFSEPKIPQLHFPPFACRTLRSFSALQRAENSSIIIASVGKSCRKKFQCSSASRKFLNAQVYVTYPFNPYVSVLFSEPKIPQSPVRCVTQNAT